MQCLKSGLQFNVSEGSVSTNNHIHTNLFDLAIAFGGWELKLQLDREQLFIKFKLFSNLKPLKKAMKTF